MDYDVNVIKLGTAEGPIPAIKAMRDFCPVGLKTAKIFIADGISLFNMDAHSYSNPRVVNQAPNGRWSQMTDREILHTVLETQYDELNHLLLPLGYALHISPLEAIAKAAEEGLVSCPVSFEAWAEERLKYEGEFNEDMEDPGYGKFTVRVNREKFLALIRVKS